ncbi:BTAD domain-containing putative transcriptional regulator [Streptomyces sp. ME19-01-6]|uniref:AfsR/SARP family transcriptional regulator n=1 Tax=Streptomyces sp. ME19-01-6 TaxID=3028686 RepID=UPI0029B5462C|nr:BTAD domain-containing putative transcriptional regulator [Streptomyces sp. ME19-01-6]
MLVPREPRPSGQLRFAVLGPVRIWRGEEQLSTGSRQQRALLAALLLRGGRTATAPELTDALWGENPPHAAIAALRTYASRLRKVLGPDVLISESGGYAIRTEAGALDLAVAQDLAAEAEEARHAGDRARARELFNEALARWDGEPLADVPGPYAEGQRLRLEEWRLSLLETRLALDLELGLHAEAVSELTALTAAHPLRERLRELLMLALYRSGRQAEALAVYADTRRLLAYELGVDPSAELSDLQQRILQADSALATPVAVADHAMPPPPPVPRQLPATIPDFTGRDAFVHELGEQLTTAEGGVMAISAVAGIGGIGKTTLAVHLAHAVRHQFPDGQLYVDLQGASPTPAVPETVLGSFLRSLGTPDSDIPDGMEDRAALFRSLLGGRRVLVLLDNARDAAQVRPLLPGTEGCATIITSRVRMVDLAGSHLVDLDVMSPEEALTLFTRIVGEERVRAEREAALDVVAACGFLPLAIRIAASRLAARRTWTVSVLAAKLADGRRQLDELRAGDLAVKATFELGYEQLEPRQARAFRLLGLADGPDLSLPAAAALLDMDVLDTEDLLESLVDASLLDSAAPGRYRYHHLVRLYARACAERDEPPQERDAALSRLLDFYLATAARAYALGRPGDRLVDHLTPTDHPGLDFPDRTAALDWLYGEASCLLACVAQAASGPAPGTMPRRAADLLLTVSDLVESGANPGQYEAVADTLSTAAEAAGDHQAEGRARIALSLALSLRGAYEQADEQARLARNAGLRAPDAGIAGHVLNQRGTTALSLGRVDEAEGHLRQAIEAFRAAHDRPGEADALCVLSQVHLALGRTAGAVELARRGVALYESLGLTLRLANGQYALGVALTRTGQGPEAVAQLAGALDRFVANRQQLWEGMAHQRLAEAWLAMGRPAQAATHAEQALIRGGIGGEWRRATVLTVLGRALMEIGHAVRAHACWREALAIHELLGAAEAEDVRALLGEPALAAPATPTAAASSPPRPR